MIKPVVFDGRKFAQEKINLLKLDMLNLNVDGIFPHLASIIIGDNPASKLYVNLKKKAGEKIGIQVDIYALPEKVSKEDVSSLINSLNNDNGVNGIMIQLPIPGKLASFKDELIDAISPEKDVDGLRGNSLFIHPTSKAVLDIFDHAQRELKLNFEDKKVAVVGSSGMVGAPLVNELKKRGYSVLEFDSKSDDLKSKLNIVDIVVSATGVNGIITAEMVKTGVIAIDVGSPVGDFDKEVSNKSLFFTPVPGGVGPVTITCLLENLILSAKKNI